MRLRTAILAGLAASAIDAPAQAYPVPSFDCANTTTAQELRICRSPRLAELDGRQGALAARAVRASPDRERAVAEMDGWLEHVRNPCQTDECLVAAYTARIRELEAMGPAESGPPAITAPAARTPALVAAPAPAAAAAVPHSAPIASLDDLPPDAEDDDESEEFSWTDYAIAFGIVALLAALAMFVVGRRARPSEDAARDAAGGPT